jgi:hypothetical protein
MRRFDLLAGAWCLLCALMLTMQIYGLGVYVRPTSVDIMTLGFIGTFFGYGYVAIRLSQIGWNTDHLSYHREKGRYNARTRQVFFRFPLSISVILLAFIHVPLHVIWFHSNESILTGLLIFNLIGCFVGLRLLTSARGRQLIEGWYIEDRESAKVRVRSGAKKKS